MSDKTGGDLATPLEELVEIGGMLDAMIAAPRREVADPSERYRYGFLEGRAFELTREMDCHPDGWNHACGCHECASL